MSRRSEIFSRSPWGRVLLHLEGLLRRPSRWRFFMDGLRRELLPGLRATVLQQAERIVDTTHQDQHHA